MYRYVSTCMCEHVKVNVPIVGKLNEMITASLCGFWFFSQFHGPAAQLLVVMG